MRWRSSRKAAALYDLGERYGTVFCLPLLAQIFAELGAGEKSARLVGATIAQLEETRPRAVGL